MSPSHEPVSGRVAQLCRFPVKSMAGETVASAELSWYGVAGDRRWAFLRPHSTTQGFPWQTLREEPRMCLYTARLRDPVKPDSSTVDVRTPEGTDLAVTDPSLPDMLGDDLRLMRLSRGLYDSMPVSVITTATVRALCRDADVDVDPRRFRPNLLVESDEPFVENTWVGRTVRVGEAALRIDRRDPRCIIVNVDPASGRSSSDMLRLVAGRHGNDTGVYASVVRPGRVQVGDELRDESPGQE